MGKHPFGEYATKYMDSVKGMYAEETWKTRDRRYRRMEQKVIHLKNQKMISTMSPKSMTVEDVRTYILYAMETLSPADMVHEVNALRNLLLFADNSAVDICFNHYPKLKPVMRGNRRKAAMQDEVYDLILERSRHIDPRDFRLVRAYALVLLCLNVGTRNKEIRLANVEDLDVVSWTFDIIHVKGEASYGQQRQVPVHPEIRPLVQNYLLLRNLWMADKHVKSNALFPSKDSKDGYLSSNSIRVIKGVVEDDLGIQFDLRECRRTFGQRYIDKNLDIESVSVLMGHSTTRTTESFYSRKKLDHAMKNAMKTWESKEPSDDEDTEDDCPNGGQ